MPGEAGGFQTAVEWLLAGDEPAVRVLTLTDVLGRPADAPDVTAEREQVFDGPIVCRLLEGQHDDGGFGVSAYAKWHGTHWRLLAVTELGVPADERLLAAYEHELRWVRSPGRLRRPGPVEGRYRRCGSQEGAALAVGVHLGMASDERVRAIASDLIEWQWPDGGWNCDIRPAATHSSFHESLKPMWGLAEFARVTGDRDAARAAESAVEFFLTHRLFRSERTGEPYPNLLRLRFPAYWHYDILDALVVMTRVGRIGDERTTDALDVIEQKRQPDGLWHADGAWWRPLGARTGVDIVDWGRRGPNVFVTLNAMRVLRAAGRVRDNVAT